MRFAKRIDANHTATVNELKKRGVKCFDFSGAGGGVTDVITWHRGFTVLIEIKFGKDAELKKTQAKFLSEWPGFCGIALDVEQAYRLATEPERYSLTQKQKDVLAGVYFTMSGKKTRLPPVLRMLEAA